MTFIIQGESHQSGDSQQADPHNKNNLFHLLIKLKGYAL